MAIGIGQQPLSESLVAAYRPIYILVVANQQPSNGNPCPVVIADLYFDGTYYSSISVTDFDPVYIWILVLNYYTFDIQDKVQEYLRSKFARIYEQTNGDMESMANQDLYSCSIQVKLRESYIDADGFTQFYGTAPVQGTKYTAPVSGTGTVTSNLFYALNATLTHEDNPNFEAHLNAYKDPFQSTFALSHRPNYMTYINKQIAGGKYYICRDDNDYIFCFSNNNLSTAWSIQVKGKYKNGGTFTSLIISYPTIPTTPLVFKTYALNAGIPYLRSQFSTVNWDNVTEYEVFVFAPFYQAMRQYYYVNQCGCCDEHTRIFFLNNLGTYDGINFEFKSEQNKSNSESWQSSLPGVFGTPSKSNTGINRMQPKQNDYYEVQCKCYDEADMNWIKELLGTPKAYVQWNGTQGQRNGLLAIVIDDSEVQTLKTNGRYEYIISVKYKLANERINLRN